MTTDLALLADVASRLQPSGPRYTSYPTANHFADGTFDAIYQEQWALDPSAPISVYVHVPFCATVCYYCACNKVHTANRVHADTYVQHLVQEIEQQAQVTGARRVSQLHFGGGTPTTLDDGHMRRVFSSLNDHFELESGPNRDFSIELDPRKVSASQIANLAQLGINRISVGIQDFDPKVQAAVNRVQSVEETQHIIDTARQNGVKSVSVDLIYGLPLQTPDSFAKTLRQTLELKPDRISLYNYAHLPHLFKTQRQINAEDLPTAETKLALFMQAIATLESEGYIYLGMDHFTKETDSLAHAAQTGTLQRNFMGYTTHGNCDLLALGLSAIGQTQTLYTQNHKTLSDYYASVDAKQIPITKGLQLNRDDVVRRHVIQSLMCTMRLDKAQLPQTLGLDPNFDFDSYFRLEKNEIAKLVAEGLLVNTPSSMQVTETGRFFIRNICMAFDAYLNRSQIRFSQTV